MFYVVPNVGPTGGLVAIEAVASPAFLSLHVHSPPISRHRRYCSRPLSVQLLLVRRRSRTRGRAQPLHGHGRTLRAAQVVAEGERSRIELLHMWPKRKASHAVSLFLSALRYSSVTCCQRCQQRKVRAVLAFFFVTFASRSRMPKCASARKTLSSFSFRPLALPPFLVSRCIHRAVAGACLLPAFRGKM